MIIEKEGVNDKLKLLALQTLRELALSGYHMMLLDLLCKGIERFNLNIYDELSISINRLQTFFTNINIQINVINYSKSDLIINDKLYSNRYIKFTSENPSLMVINGSHQIVNSMHEIKSFFLIDHTYNLCISFNFII